VPHAKETPSAADKNAAESSEKKQQTLAGSSSKTNNSKASGATGPMSTVKTSAISSAPEILRISTDNDATGKTEVSYYSLLSIKNG
jgi:hypothetical protein